MKRILAITILMAACSYALGATQTTGPKAESHTVPNGPGQQTGHLRASAKSNHASHAGVFPKPNHLPVNPDLWSRAATSRKAQQPAKGKAKQIASTGRTTGTPVNNTRPREVSALPRPSASSPNEMRHHGSNPPSVGGPLLQNTANSGTISGSNVKRRP